MKSVRNAMAALRCFSRAEAELSVAEISRRLDLPKSTVSRLLSAMRDGGLLEQDPVSRRYAPGSLAFQLGALYRSRTLLSDLVRKAVDTLVAETGYTGYVGVLDGGEIVILSIRQGSYPVRSVIEPGTRLSAPLTAIGRALLAQRPDEAVRALYPRGIPRLRDSSSLLDLDRLIADLEVSRRRGWADVGQEVYPGMGAIGVAIEGPPGEQDIAFSLSYPVPAVDAAGHQAMVAALLGAARQINRRIGVPVREVAQPAA